MELSYPDRLNQFLSFKWGNSLPSLTSSDNCLDNLIELIGIIKNSQDQSATTKAIKRCFKFVTNKIDPALAEKALDIFYSAFKGYTITFCDNSKIFVSEKKMQELSKNSTMFQLLLDPNFSDGRKEITFGMCDKEDFKFILNPDLMDNETLSLEEIDRWLSDKDKLNTSPHLIRLAHLGNLIGNPFLTHHVHCKFKQPVKELLHCAEIPLEKKFAIASSLNEFFRETNILKGGNFQTLKDLGIIAISYLIELHENKDDKYADVLNQISKWTISYLELPFLIPGWDKLPIEATICIKYPGRTEPTDLETIFSDNLDDFIRPDTFYVLVKNKDLTDQELLERVDSHKDIVKNSSIVAAVDIYRYVSKRELYRKFSEKIVSFTVKCTHLKNQIANFFYDLGINKNLKIDIDGLCSDPIYNHIVDPQKKLFTYLNDRIFDWELNLKVLHPNISLIKNLKELYLKGCDSEAAERAFAAKYNYGLNYNEEMFVNDNIKNSHLSILTNFKRLKSLTIKNAYFLTGDCFSNLPVSLKLFTIFNGVALTNESFSHLPKNIRCLQIHKNSYEDGLLTDELGKNLQHLSSLSILYISGFKDISVEKISKHLTKIPKLILVVTPPE
jgi:hypothetical protein